MDINYKQLPFYIQFTIKLIMISLLALIIIYGRTLFIPLAFSILLSILLLPLTNFLERRLYFPKGFANISAVLLALAVIAVLVWFLSHQMATFLRDIPSIKEHLEMHYENIAAVGFRKKFHISENTANDAY